MKIINIIKTTRNKLINKLPLTILGILISITTYIRFYNFPDQYILGDETVREAVIGLYGAQALQAPLIGAFSSAGPFTWGPWFYYQVIIASILIPHTFAPWIFLSICSILSIIVLYKIGKELENSDFGLLLAALGMISPAMHLASIHLTFPNLISFFALIVVLLFIKLIKSKSSYKNYVLFGLVLGITGNIHYQAAGLLILVIVAALFAKKKIESFISMIVGIVITGIPMLIFELSNNWFNTINISYYLRHGKDLIYVPNRWLFYVRDFWPELWADTFGVPKYVAVMTILVGFSYTAYLLYKRKLPKSTVLLLIVFAINFIQLRYYWGERFYGYFIYLRPFIFLVSGYALFYFYRLKHGRMLVIVLIIAYSAVSIPSIIQKNQTNITFNEALADYTILEQSFPNENFSIYTCKEVGNSVLSGKSKSLLLFLDYKKRLSVNGRKIAYHNSDCDCLARDESVDLVLEEICKKIDNSNLVEYVSNENVAGEWEILTFKSIYDSTVRWWYDEKP